jgi:hypothetical protein
MAGQARCGFVWLFGFGFLWQDMISCQDDCLLSGLAAALEGVVVV